MDEDEELRLFGCTTAQRKVAYEILDGVGPTERKAALVQHCNAARYPKALWRKLAGSVRGAYTGYLCRQVAAILEPERKKELGL